ncbi:hypothetical protein SOVF_113360 [Spinacia oleracea]|nr:hypothetical protein SOVF_113360 [Spinacia oleracea]
MSVSDCWWPLAAAAARLSPTTLVASRRRRWWPLAAAAARKNSITVPCSLFLHHVPCFLQALLLDAPTFFDFSQFFDSKINLMGNFGKIL